MTNEQGIQRHILVVWSRAAGSKGGLSTNGVGGIAPAPAGLAGPAGPGGTDAG